MSNSHILDMKSSPSLMKWCLLGLLALVLSGCATVPAQTSQRSSDRLNANDQSVNVSAVRENPQAFSQSEVQWGGVVESVENRDNETVLEVVERPLNRSGEPQINSLSLGRFIAVVPGFLDPADYRSGQVITVRGNVSGVQNGKIGEFEYDFPRIAVADHQLWLPSTKVAARTTRSSKRGDYYSPYRGSFSIGIALGAYNGLRFGFNNFGYRPYRGGFYKPHGFKRNRRIHRRGFSNRLRY